MSTEAREPETNQAFRFGSAPWLGTSGASAAWRMGSSLVDGKVVHNHGFKGILAAPPKATPPRNKGLIRPY